MKPPVMLDGANVIMWAWSGEQPFGHVDTIGTSVSELIYGLAICTYNNSQEIYRFSCNINWEVVQDGHYQTIEQAIDQLPNQYKNVKAIWHKI